ncbi:MAG TPA: protein BatD, partial [Myxococcaceae bacterium]|nr:protein BatD [Myxococcaceae bacterium]
VTPQQTGTVTFPPMRFDYFDPSAGEYKVSEIGPLTVRVTPGDPSAQGVDDGAVAKNVLTGGGLRPMHRRPGFGTASGPVWTAPWFWPAVVAPALAYAALLAAAALTRRAKVETPDGTRRKKASAAERRLRAAREAKAASAAEFYGEVEKAVGQFLEARLHLGAPFAGMTRDALSVRMGEQGVAAERQAQVLALLDRCDVGRYSPGATLSDRDAVLKAAAAVMEGWV